MVCCHCHCRRLLTSARSLLPPPPGGAIFTPEGGLLLRGISASSTVGSSTAASSPWSSVLAVLLLFWAVFGEADYMLYKDAAQPVEARVSDLRARMTLAEKIGQMTQIERLVASPQVLKDNFIGKHHVQIQS